jgi:hypothetical protein
MGDATPALIREMNQHGPPPLVSEVSPLSAAGNLLDLHGQLREIANRSQVQVDASNENLAATNPTPGFLTLDSLHGMATLSGVPFALIVDGCLQDSAFTDALNALGFDYDEHNPNQFYYVGPSDVVTREAWDMASAMRNFGRQRPFLTGSNPVILSAKPGTFAMARKNPFLVGGPAIGPLAERAHMLAQSTLVTREPWDLVTLVSRLAEFNGIGEINLEGSISWSDFDEWKLAKARPEESVKDPVVKDVDFSPQPSTAIVERFTPDIGEIQDFAFAEESNDFILSDFSEGIWSWRPGRKAERTEAELAFSSVGATSNGLLVYHGGQTNELRAVSPEKPLLAENLYLGHLARGYQGTSILVLEDDSTVDQPSPIHRLLPSKPLEQLGSLETTGMQSAVEWQSGKIYFTTDSNAIHYWEKGSVREFCRGLAEPQWLACDDQFLYCLSRSGRTLHRISDLGKIEGASLEALALERSNTARAFQGCKQGKILIGSGTKVLAIDLSKLTWQVF